MTDLAMGFSIAHPGVDVGPLDVAYNPQAVTMKEQRRRASADRPAA